MTDTAAKQAIDVGAVVAGTYEITRLIGRGGMGAVFEARHLRLEGKRVAIKVLHAEIAADAESVARFRREADIASRLGHPNIVQVHDFNELPDGAQYLVLEYLEGECLADRLARGPLPREQVLAIVRQVGSALQAAHSEQIIHRDLKPHNVFLCPTETGGYVSEVAKVLDFGISKMRNSQTVKTQAHTMLGTPQYMAPEQALGNHDAVDARTDVFALGIMVYEMLAGRPPFLGSNIPEVVFKVVYEEPERLDALVPSLEPYLVAAVHKALAKQQDERFADVSAFVEALTGDPLNTLRGGPMTARSPARPLPTPGSSRAPSHAPEALAGTVASGNHPALAGTVASGNHPAALAGTMASGNHPVALAGTMASAGAAQTATPAHAQGTPAATEPGAKPRRSAALFAGVAAAVLIAGVAVAVVTMGGSGEPAQPREPAIAGDSQPAAAREAKTRASQIALEAQERAARVTGKVEDISRQVEDLARTAESIRDIQGLVHPAGAGEHGGDDDASPDDATPGDDDASESKGKGERAGEPRDGRRAQRDERRPRSRAEGRKSGEPTETSAIARLQRAREFLRSESYDQAIREARSSLGEQQSSAAHALITHAYCAMRDLGNANASFRNVKAGRAALRRLCARKYNIELAGR